MTQESINEIWSLPCYKWEKRDSEIKLSNFWGGYNAKKNDRS